MPLSPGLEVTENPQVQFHHLELLSSLTVIKNCSELKATALREPSLLASLEPHSRLGMKAEEEAALGCTSVAEHLPGVKELGSTHCTEIYKMKHDFILEI